MKKVLAILLSAVMIAQAGMIVGFAGSAEKYKQTITISNIDTMQLAGETGESPTEISAEGLRSNDIKIVSEEWTGISEIVIGRKDVSIKDGKYSYRLVLRSNGTLTFDNDLEVYYQGVNGKYRLHYDIDETDNHTMIVTGVFDNIIVASPLLDRLSAEDREWILSHISQDSYFYQLLLKTKEGFSFMNTLQFLIDAHKYGYSVKYAYDLLTNKQTVVITDISDCGQNDTDEAVTGETDASQGSSGADQPAVREPAKPAAQHADRSQAGSSVVPVRQKAANPLSVQGKTARIKYRKLRKKTQTLNITDVVRFNMIGEGAMTFAKASGNKKISVDNNTGRITVKKGLKKGTYKVNIVMKAAENEDYEESPVSAATFKIIVK